MHIACLMFSRGLGGLEQSLLDYCEALRSQGHEVTSFIFPGAAIEEPIIKLSRNKNFSVERLRNFGQWDLLAIFKLRKKLIKIKPDAIITFGNRAAVLAKHAAKNIAPIIARTPNYNVKKIIGFDGILHTTEHLKEHIAAMGHPHEKLFHVPNMINVPSDFKFKFKKFNKPPVIGTMGRFVEKKGIAEFIKALAEMKELDLDFRAIIGGEGEESGNLKNLVKELGLEKKVRFVGWVSDKQKFFDSIDIFCLPSLHEPFGIVLLEAFLSGKPVVTTNTEGPSEIACHGHDAIIVPKGNVRAMADALGDLLQNQKMAETLAINALKTLRKRYDTKIVSEKLDNALKQIVNKK